MQLQSQHRGRRAPWVAISVAVAIAVCVMVLLIYDPGLRQSLAAEIGRALPGMVSDGCPSGVKCGH